MSYEAESNSKLTVIVPAYQLHFRFLVQNKIFCRTPGPAYLAVLPVLVIFCPLGPTNFKKSAIVQWKRLKNITCNSNWQIISENEIPSDKSGKMTAGPIKTLGFQDRLSGIALSFDFGYYNWFVSFRHRIS